MYTDYYYKESRLIVNRNWENQIKSNKNQLNQLKIICII